MSLCPLKNNLIPIETKILRVYIFVFTLLTKMATGTRHPTFNKISADADRPKRKLY